MQAEGTRIEMEMDKEMGTGTRCEDESGQKGKVVLA